MPTPPEEKTINEEVGLPDNWTPIDAPPIVPGQNDRMMPGQMPQSPGPYYVGPISPTLQHDTAFYRTGYQTGSIAVTPLMPLALNGFPSNGAAIQSVAETSGSSKTPVTPVVPSTNVQLFEVNNNNLIGPINYINGFAT